MLLGAVEAGGTKFICAIGTNKGEIVEKTLFPTTTPKKTLENVINFFKDREIEALGIGCFGPIDINRKSKTYGYITSTPKKKWAYYNIIGELKKYFNVPINFNTDVNGAVLGEVKWGNSAGLSSVLYITIGTGIGGGVFTNGAIVQGMTHSEAGHMLVRRHKYDSYKGCCPYHDDCLEGMASGLAMENRWKIKPYNLQKKDKAWELEAYYLAQGLVNYILIVSPDKIILGGGLMKQLHLFPLIRKEVSKILNGYVRHANILKNIDDYIVPSKLGDDAGVYGALALAEIIT